MILVISALVYYTIDLESFFLLIKLSLDKQTPFAARIRKALPSPGRETRGKKPG